MIDPDAQAALCTCPEPEFNEYGTPFAELASDRRPICLERYRKRPARMHVPGCPVRVEQ